MDTEQILRKIKNAVPILSQLYKAYVTADWAEHIANDDCNFSIEANFGPGSWSKNTFTKKRLQFAVTLPITLKQFITADYWEGQEGYCPHWAYLTVTSKGYATFCVEHIDGGIALSPELKWTGRADKIVDRVINFYKEMTVLPTQEISSWQQDEIDKIAKESPKSDYPVYSGTRVSLLNYASLDGVLFANFCEYSFMPYASERYSMLYIIGSESSERIYYEKYDESDDGKTKKFSPQKCIKSVISAKMDGKALVLQCYDARSEGVEITLLFSQDQRKNIINLIGKVLAD